MAIADRAVVQEAAPATAISDSRGFVRSLLILVFCSGISGLIYQMLWVRMLTLAFGITVYAVSTVLTSFMAGLALGSFLAGRISDRTANPLRLYGLVEVGIGLTGLLTLVAFSWIQDIYKLIFTQWPSESLVTLSLVRFALCFLVLLVPTSLMGATLPTIARSSLLRSPRFSRNVSLLYALNTAGAIVGTFGAGFYLIGGYGVRSSILIAAALNLLVGVIALKLSSQVRGRTSLQEDENKVVPESRVDTIKPYPASARRAAFVAFGLGGACSLAYEVVWTRVLVIFSNSSTYAFTIMLCMVLVGITAGSYAINYLIQRRLNWLLVFALIELGVGALGLGSILLFAQLYSVLGWTPGPGISTHLPISRLAIAAGFVIIPPMFLLGMTFPVATRLYVSGFRDVGRRLGSIYAVNVFGAIFGSFAAGFILVPVWGTQTSLVILSIANLALALLLLWAVPSWRLPGFIWKPFTGLAVVALLWMGLPMLPNMYEGIFKARFPGEQVLWWEEGLENMVAVGRNAQTGIQAMYLNGRHQASDSAYATQYHRIIGHLPMLVHPNPREVLIIGLGGGATAGAFTRYPNVQLDVVELSGSVLRAAEFFRHVSYDVLHQPGVRVREDDGRNSLLLTSRRYDIITADIILPETAGSANLYSLEYFQLVRDALKQDGIMVQWIQPTYDFQYRMIMRTFLEVFPHVTLWVDGNLMIGSKTRLTLDRSNLERKFRDPSIAAALREVSMIEVYGLLNKFNATEEELWPQLSGIPAITDDHPYTEYFRSWANEHRTESFDLRALSHDDSKILARP